MGVRRTLGKPDRYKKRVLLTTSSFVGEVARVVVLDRPITRRLPRVSYEGWNINKLLRFDLVNGRVKVSDHTGV